MLIIFESILPVFLLVVLGALLKRWPKIDGSLWNGLEQLGYYVLFPALLFATLAKADFGGIAAGATAVSSIGAVTLMSAMVLAGWPLLRGAGVSGATYTRSSRRRHAGTASWRSPLPESSTGRTAWR